ncbi:hypothetical protein ANANG_G00034520 [Anguilla anguilla]|uniref:Uncharacterized protein n=1 Tax=Anguilla anguilla TaxID=7936 RepID=A0A9D3MUQ5_ANGAN|nr:hypothetical protein ANANG_G00034520 [Anguilla anguilla]
MIKSTVDNKQAKLTLNKDSKNPVIKTGMTGGKKHRNHGYPRPHLSYLTSGVVAGLIPRLQV